MGCCSGSLWLQGCYIPKGISLSYLQAGSPVIIANLWEVTSGDIDEFGMAIVDTLSCEREKMVKESETMKIKGRK
ncbi:Peptidase C50, separase [Corchorus olitorius]|uniref:Peptidase C50, separase n=1 Tax=Corchorus olitorius TaxID=93759 RepID=A0A1R3FVR9_9ROSI|nr:Peptidase C50, separase [Corchorus olitorius]